MDADEPAKLKVEDVEPAARVTRRKVEGHRRAAVMLMHLHPAQFKTAPLDEADDPPDRPFAGREVDRDLLWGSHQLVSSISTLDELGGTRGQTFARGSMRTWHSTGPLVDSSRSMALETSVR